MLIKSSSGVCEHNHGAYGVVKRYLYTTIMSQEKASNSIWFKIKNAQIKGVSDLVPR